MAEQAVQQLPQSDPEDAEALQFLATRQWERGGAKPAIELLHGEPGAAANILRKSLQVVPGMFVARLRGASRWSNWGATKKQRWPAWARSSTRLVIQLPLIEPPDCRLRVGGETHLWQTGRCVTFDDTFEHAACNHSDRDRVELILASWNPDLSEAEKAAVADLVAAIVDFNRAG